MTVTQYLDHWLENISRPTVRRNTYLSYKGVIDNSIKPIIGRIRLDKITPVNVQAMYGKLEDEGRSARYRQLTHAVLRRALNVAMKQGLVIRNVCQAVDPPRVEKRKIETLAPDQVQKLLDETEGTPSHALFVLAITCGLRQGELFALHWSDVDFDRGTLSVSKTLLEADKAPHIGPPKSKSAIRVLILPPIAVEALEDHQKMQADAGLDDNELIFTSEKGMFIRKSNFQRKVFKPLLRACELPDIRFHDLRHTSATLLLQQGVHPKVVQGRLGHSQISLTMDTYSHLMPAMDAEAAQLMNTLLKPTTTQLPPKPINAEN